MGAGPVYEDVRACFGEALGALVQVMEGTEPTTFKANFKVWDEVRVAAADFSRGSVTGNVAVTPRSKSSKEIVSGLMDSADKMARERMASRAAIEGISKTGKTTVWRIEDFKEVRRGDVKIRV